MFDVDLSADEAGFFALHFVNAEDGGKTMLSDFHYRTSDPDIVEKYYDNMEFRGDNLYYQRFLTHLKYLPVILLQRASL